MKNATPRVPKKVRFSAMVVGSSMSPLLAGLCSDGPLPQAWRAGASLNNTDFFAVPVPLRTVLAKMCQSCYPRAGKRACGPGGYSRKNPAGVVRPAGRTSCDAQPPQQTGTCPAGPGPVPGQLPLPVRRAVRRLLRTLPPRRSRGADGGAADALPVQRLRGAGRRTTCCGPGTRTPGPPSWNWTRTCNGGAWTSFPRGRGGPLDTEGTVEFKAHFRHDGERGVHHETSRFVRAGPALVLPGRRRVAKGS